MATEPEFEEQEPLPALFKVLFPDDARGEGDLTKITETPAKMILPLVRMRIIDAAHDPKRKISLLELFVKEFDARMISRDRSGRVEAVRIMQGAMQAGDEEEEASM